MSKTVETAQDIFRDAYANGGGTYFVSVQRNRVFVGKSALATGYYVATEGNEWCLSRYAFTDETVSDFIVQNFKTLTDNGNFYLGIWQADSGRWYMDVSEHFRDEFTALSSGAARKQIAIWDIARSREIAVSAIHADIYNPEDSTFLSREEALSRY